MRCGLAANADRLAVACRLQLLRRHAVALAQLWQMTAHAGIVNLSADNDEGQAIVHSADCEVVWPEASRVGVRNGKHVRVFKDRRTKIGWDGIGRQRRKRWGVKLGLYWHVVNS